MSPKIELQFLKNNLIYEKICPMEKLYVGGDILSELETQISIYHSKLIKNICYDVFKDPSLIPKMLSKYTIKHTQSNCQVAPDKPTMERHHNLLNLNPESVTDMSENDDDNQGTATDVIITDKKHCLALVHLKRQLRQCTTDPLAGMKYCSLHSTQKKQPFGTLEGKDHLVI